jgi:hypothetical protein
MNVYQRDHSFYAGRPGRGGKYHFLGRDLASKCGRARMLQLEDPMPARAVPTVLRCKARGCCELW